MGLSIREWLRNTHADLEVYSAQFEELGYNLQFLMETVARWSKMDVEIVCVSVQMLCGLHSLIA